ncbi:MAG TPA: hypothetical protein VIY73_18805 [Polyangiaceae bacterium]
MSERTCPCGARHPLDAGRLVGPQQLGGGEIAILRNCPGCATTYSGAVMTDAAVCEGCGRVVAGTTDDPKTTLEGGTVLCLDCAASDMRVPRVTYGRRRRRVA